jgi:tetratricopeptide (TPR) repeat protein
MKLLGKTTAILFYLALLGGTSSIFALPDTGKILNAEDSPAGKPLPAGTDPRLAAALYSLRDSVYMNESAELIEDKAEGLVKTVESPSAASLQEIDRLLLASRAEFLAGRALNEAGLKEKAIARFDAAVELAKKSLVPGDHIPGLMALIRPLSELCLLKGMGFLLSNGPLVPRYTRQILDQDPSHRAATITLASSKAYPPGIFGGNPKEAITMLEKLLSEHPEGFEKDELFDLRACFGTAYAKLGDKAKAAFWFRAALEIYPGNRYAREELERLGG